MNAIKYLIALSVLLITCSFYAQASSKVGTHSLHFDTAKAIITKASGDKVSFSVEVANTDAKRHLGLMFRKKLPENSGMVFEFSPPRVVSMWMKNTLIPLDIIYVNEKNIITFIQKNTTPKSTSTISFPHPVATVMEVNAGLAKKLGIAIGDKLVYSFAD